MAIERWDPFREMVSLRDAFNSLLQESFVRPDSLPSGGSALVLPLDISETPEAFVVRASLPGIKPEDVQVTIHGDTLTIQAETQTEQEQEQETWHLRERRHGTFRRTVTLAVPVDADRATAEHDHGVLRLTLPKAESARPKQIKVGPAASRSS
ncbi:Hsp20/alpha crystallin family protein [Tautonia rosea]|uniref:Hsp20/alpha crystallin family protein n=1 Tax=Tautonia rosea TaxID=2728037 RepID=UPI001474A4AF|nr:Hsp20/alpha crystallin family protein [Tautonia rosea]